MKELTFLGDTRERIRNFPAKARSQAGYELREVQKGKEPSDWKPMPTVDVGVKEVRIALNSGAFRVVYLATLPQCVLALHAFKKTTRKTPKKEIDLARQRLKEWKAEHEK